MASLTLRLIPEDVLKHILREQLSIKIEKKRGQYSLEKTVLKIIKEHEEMKIKKQCI